MYVSVCLSVYRTENLGKYILSAACLPVGLSVCLCRRCRSRGLVVVALVVALVVARVVGRPVLLVVSRLVGRTRGLGRRGHLRVLLPLEVVGDSAAEAQEGEGAEDRRDDRAWLGLGLGLGLGLRVGLGVCLRVCSRVGLGLRGGLGLGLEGGTVPGATYEPSALASSVSRHSRE